MTNTHLNEIRSHAGLLVQFLATFPALILLMMGVGSGNFDGGVFLASLKTPQDHLLVVIMIGIPIIGILTGFFVNAVSAGLTWYRRCLELARASSSFPSVHFLGGAVLALLGRVCFYEFR